MSDVFVDTSAFVALLLANDVHHARAAARFRGLLEDGSRLVSHNYVLLETFSLVHARVGLDCARAFHQDVLPVVDVDRVTAEDHQIGVGAVLAAGRRHLSLVDCVSFAFLRRTGIRRVFGFDRHFAAQGFEIV